MVRVRAISKEHTSVASVIALSLIGGGLALVGLGLAFEDDDSRDGTIGLGAGALVGGFVLLFVGGAADNRTTPDVSVSPMRKD